MLTNKTIFVLDTYGLLYQLFHALPPMNSPQGEPVGAVYGFVKDLFRLIDQHHPDYLFCAFDLPEKTFRSEIYPDYKANRSEMPEDLRPQISFVREVLDAMRVLPLGVTGFEADDLMATVAHLTAQQNGNCIIVTSDKDCRQLINEHVSLFNLRKQLFYRADELLTDWGITPEQVVDFQSLVGDATDNVPGVPKIGPKTATELLKQFQSLDGIYEHLGEITGKKKEYLADNKESALLSRKLVRLRDDVPLEIDWTKNAYHGINHAKLRELFIRFGFKSLLPKLELENIEPKEIVCLFTLNQNEIFDSEIISSPEETLPDSDSFEIIKPVYHLIDTLEKFDEFYCNLSKQKEFSFDTETAPLESWFDATSPRYTVIVGMSFAWDDLDAYYLPLRGPLGAEVLPLKTTLEKLRPIFENAEIGKIGQNIKYDKIVLQNVGIGLSGIIFDTMIADYLLRTEMNHNLDDMAEHYLHHRNIKIEELIGSGKKQHRMDEVQTDIVAEYAGEDALVVWRLYPILRKQLAKKTALEKLCYEIELPLAEVLAEMEFIGVTIDTELLKKVGQRFAQRQHELEKEIYELAGHEFNIASPKQLATVLFDELGLKGVKKTKTKSGQSTDVEVLEELASEHPLPAKVVEHRQLAKLKGTYIDALPELIHPVTRRIHSSFNQVTTATGRLSSSNPNLQNIPVRSAEGREIRNAFKPGKNFDLLLSCDYSQIELRVLAHFSGDENLCAAFRNKEDIHTRVAGEVFGVPQYEVTSDMRRIAKTVNFGVIYGQSPYGLAKQLGIEQKEAKKFIDGYFAKYAGIHQYLESILDDCRVNGFVSTLFGHRRSFAKSAIREIRKGSLNQAERMAINTVIQGTAADLMKQAMVRLQKKLPKEINANLLLQIHDELVFEVTEKDAERLKDIVMETMMLDQPLCVPLVVDAELGKHWE